MSEDGRREMRLPKPEPRWCDAASVWHDAGEPGEDAWLRLIRYQGGTRGPILLAPGFAMSATSFADPVTETSLAEHLVEKGYDVWLFDYRASIDLPSAWTQFSLDDIATRDWPTAVAEVARVTGADTVQALGHCVGSATLMMALAAGLERVRSAVCMQFTLHPVTSKLNLTKTTLRLGNVLTHVGVDTVAPRDEGTMGDAVVDAGFRSFPMPPDERCGRSTCRWINGVFGCTHTHAQLSEAAHDRLDTLFGVANVRSLNHLSTIVRQAGAVTEDGDDAYLSHPERLRLPILLVQGDINYIFRPEGSLRTLEWLQAANDPGLYTRVVLPGYAHLDALLGRDASRDVFPLLSEHLGRFNT